MTGVNPNNPWGQSNTTNDPVHIDKPIREGSVTPDAPHAPTPQNKPNIPAAQDNFPAVNVAILLPLSGAHSGIGQSMLQGAQLALFEMGYTL